MHMKVIAPRSNATSDYAQSWPSSDPNREINRVASAAICTVAAFVPETMSVSLLDESVDRFDDALHMDADIYGLTANVGQATRGIELADKLRAAGKTVIMGGPHVSLAPDLFVDHADCLVVGEFETVAEQLFADLQAGALKPRYTAGKWDMQKSPVPRWDLYPNEHTFAGIVQTSRGCPFECHFCDVIQYLGRVQRHKDNDLIIAELQQLYDLGYNYAVLADDNFTVYRKRTRAILEAIAKWNGKEGREYMAFATQMSIDVARDPDILEMCVEAGLVNAFIGIESDNEESLKESKKRQNLKVNLVDQLRAIVSKGMRLESGLMVGFDHDSKACFERQVSFGMAHPTATFNISVLVAPVATPLYASMVEEKRLVAHEVVSQFPSSGMVSNIIPSQMTREELFIGARWLVSKLFHPESFLERFRNISEILGQSPWDRADASAPRRQPRQKVSELYSNIFRWEMRENRDYAAIVKPAMKIIKANPEIRDGLTELFANFTMAVHTRRRQGIYDAEWAKMDAPPFDSETGNHHWQVAVGSLDDRLLHAANRERELADA
ncbi:MAG: radical SAM protein [Kiloniellales bacterium]